MLTLKFILLSLLLLLLLLLFIIITIIIIAIIAVIVIFSSSYYDLFGRSVLPERHSFAMVVVGAVELAGRNRRIPGIPFSYV